MDAYSPSATCPKCGGSDIGVTYAAEHCAWSTPACGLLGADKYREHMDRHCQRCHYE